MKNASLSSSSPHALQAPVPLDAPMRKGRVVRVPEHWTGPLSHAPFEAILKDNGQILLGVGVQCRHNRLKPGALWILCENGADVLNRAKILDAALALTRATKEHPASLGNIPAARLVEALIWMEAGANAREHASGVWAAGARSLFADTARGLKKALSQHLPNDLLALIEPSPSLMHH